MRSLFTLFAALLLSGNALATTIDFEDQAFGALSFSDPFVSNGYEFTNIDIGAGWSISSPESGHALIWSDGVVGMKAQDGSAFNLHSFDFDSFGGGADFSVVGYFASGGSIQIDLVTAGDIGGVTAADYFELSSPWLGLDRIEFHSYTSPGVVNNIVVSAVPVPAAVWLFGSGLGLLGWVHRRKTG